MSLLPHAGLALALAGVVLTLVRTMHMFQLNSYKMRVQLNWLKKNAGKFRAHLLILLLSGLSFTGSAVFYWGLTALLLFFVPLLRPPAAKKPLVYTGRVKRMLATAAVLLIAWAAAVELLPLPYGYLVLCLGFAASPLLALLVNIINMPLEKAYVRYYINDARRILRSMPELTVVGITGSYGKTSVKYYLSTLLRGRFDVLMTPESYNTMLGVVRTIREGLRPTHRVFVCEMGARNIGDIRDICELVRPKYGILTAIGEQHLESFGTPENIVKAKFELADSIPADGMVFLNDGIARRPARPFVTYGTSADSMYSAGDIRVSRHGTVFRINTPGGAAEFRTQLIGEHNVVNLAGAIAVAHTLGVPLDELQGRIRKIVPVPHRMQLCENGAMTIIDDAYNSNPSGCRAALKTLALFDACKVLVTPGMVELGAKQDECNREFGKEAAAVCDFVALVGEEQTRPILRGLREAGYPAERVFIAGSFNEAMIRVNSIQNEKRKVVLLENDLPDNY